jgi:hypothetical protein
MMTSAQAWMLVAALAFQLVCIGLLINDMLRLQRWAQSVDRLLGHDEEGE